MFSVIIINRITIEKRKIEEELELMNSCMKKWIN
jgi:hypothetical protein